MNADVVSVGPGIGHGKSLASFIVAVFAGGNNG